MVKMQTPKWEYTFDYPQAVEFADTQAKIFWHANEVEVEKDLQDLRVNMTDAERHGVITTLKLFTLYELVAGNEYWLGRFRKMFPRPEFERMAAMFGCMELCSHAPFYNKVNEVLLLNTDEFYRSYLDDPILKERMEFIDKIVSDEDDLLSLGAFSMVEGAILYSSFAFLKHFQTEGKNKLMNTCRGIDFSVRDENLHSEGGAWAFTQLLNEKVGAGEISPFKILAIEDKLTDVARKLYEHECIIIDKIFEKGDIDGINKDELKVFVQSRLNTVLANLGIKPIYKIEKNPIADWFYDNINMVKFADFFTGMNANYNRDWKEDGFAWQPSTNN